MLPFISAAIVTIDRIVTALANRANKKSIAVRRPMIQYSEITRSVGIMRERNTKLKAKCERENFFPEQLSLQAHDEQLEKKCDVRWSYFITLPAVLHTEMRYRMDNNKNSNNGKKTKGI